jgi:hypothetical protein
MVKLRKNSAFFLDASIAKKGQYAIAQNPSSPIA